MNFTFDTVPQIIFETGAAARLGEIMATRMKHPFVVTDKGVVNAGLIDGALESLKKSGLDFHLFDGVEADPPAKIVKSAIDAAHTFKADGIIGFGGGSSMDTAKLIAVLMNSDQQLEDIYGLDQVKGDRLPLALLPTTAGTGSEVTNISVITSEEDQKIGILSRQLYPDLAILDASLTFSLPRHVTAATGIDAMVHAIEAYTNIHRKNPVSDALAKEALRLLSTNLVCACETPGDVAAREGMLLGAMLAGQAFTNSPVGAIHGMAYPLGGIFHIPHGLSNSLMMEPVLRFNAPKAAEQYAELANVIAPGDNGSDEDRCNLFIEKMVELVTATGVERRLSQLGISHNDLPLMAEDAMKAARVLVNNPREVTYEDALAMYTEVL